METIKAKCSFCGYEEEYPLSEEEALNLTFYDIFGRELGSLQDIFPKIPAWIRSGTIDKYSDGFCICPKCSK